MRKNIVLFVDDDANILSSIRRAVIAENFTALFAANAQEALVIMKTTTLSVLVTDMSMPGMDGLALLKLVKQEYPATFRIVLSGFTQIDLVLATINHGDIFRFITKPWRMEEDLLSVIRQALEYYNLRQDKKKSTLSVQHRATAYHNMLRKIENKVSENKKDLDSIKDFIANVLNTLITETNSLSNNDEYSTQLQLINEITVGYLGLMPTVLEKFSLAEIKQSAENYLQHLKATIRYELSVTHPGLTYYGNYKLFLFVLISVFKVLDKANTNRTFRCTTTSESFGSTARISSILEIGYIDGFSVLIDKKALLTHANLSLFCLTLSQMGKPYNIIVSFTYANQNSSVITITADFPVVNS